MAKPIMKFDAVAYQIGSGAQTRTGYRPVLVPQDPVSDLNFCREVVNEKRLAMSPDELLHAMEMVGEVGPAKVAEDGRPRAITKLLKWNRFAKGNLDSPSSPWNESCKARICAQLLWDADKVIDATFQNVNEGIGVRLNYVAWLGAQTVTNVVKIGKSFAAYGNHMEWIAGDSATLTVGTTSYPLTCTESDVAHAVFSWPAGLNPEAGTQAEFLMKSRGGIEEGQVYTSKKTVTILAADPTPTRATAKFCDSSGTEVYTEIYPERSSLFFVCDTHEFVNDEPITLKKYNNAGTLLETVEKTLVVDGMGTAASCTNPFTAGAGNGKVTVENTAVFGEIAWLDAEP